MVQQDRSFVKMFFLSIITFGIYSYIFWYSYAEDVNTLCEEDGKHTYNLFIAVLLSMVTLGIYGFIWHYSMQKRLCEAAYRRGLPPQKSPDNILCWSLFGVWLLGVGAWIAIYNQIETINAVAHDYNAVPGEHQGGVHRQVGSVNVVVNMNEQRAKQQPVQKRAPAVPSWNFCLSGSVNGRPMQFRDTICGAWEVGRDPQCNFVVNEGSVSHHHMRLMSKQDGVHAINLSQTNPVRINDRPLNGEIRLNEGDRVTLGHVVLTVHYQ